MNDLLTLLQTLAVTYGLRVLGSIAIFIIGLWLSRVVVNGFKRVLTKAQVDRTLVFFLGNVLYYVLLAIVFIAALSNIGIPTTSVVAILGATTLAIGLAMQDSLANLAAGVVIILLRPYQLGDYVEVGGAEGYVHDIKIFHTALTTRDNKVIYVPNSDVMDGNIVNYSRREWVRLDLVFAIGYGDDLLKAKRILQEIVAADERIAKEPAPVVAVQELGDSSVNLAVRPYVKVRDMIPITFAITEQVKLRFDEEGVEIPFPQRDVHLFQPNGGD
ncbi:MAG TPA: mechanosensitive ion channel domain-containing protein [Anaerolineae bacterium]